jgi:hypothetical protein
MKELMYLTNVDLKNKADGVGNKIKSQIKSFSKMGLNVTTPSILYKSKILKILNYIPLFPHRDFIKSLIIKKEVISNIDLIYIRKLSNNIYFILMLQRFKRINRNVKIIMEIPTYPYDKQVIELGLQGRISLFRDKIARPLLKRYIDKIVTFSNHDQIFGIETIKLQNGVDLDIVTPKKVIHKEEKRIDMICVATLSSWHGYDRVIKGIRDYYRTEHENDVYFHVVGYGKELKNLQLLSNELKLNNKIFFYGALYGEELDEIYNKCDLAFGPLAMHRVNMTQVSALKLREYCAKGIPFVKSYHDDIFDYMNFEFSYNVPDDDSPINIKNIISFIEKLKTKYKEEDLINIMRDYAAINFTWDSQIKKVIEAIQPD